MNDQENFSWLAISMQYHHKQTRKWEWRKISIRGLLVDSLPNSLYWYCDNCMQKVRRITNEILGGKGFKITEDSVQPSYPTNIAVKRHLSQPQITSFCLGVNSNHQVLVTKQIIYYDLSLIKHGLPKHWKSDKPHHHHTQLFLCCILYKPQGDNILTRNCQLRLHCL